MFKIQPVIQIGKYRWVFGIHSSIYKYKRDQWTRGTMNRTKDGKYVFYIDMDMMMEEYVKDELEYIQGLWDLGDIHIFRSSKKGFHGISFAKLTAREFTELLNGSSCDRAFKNLPMFTSYRNWVLRCFDKGKTKIPEYLYTLKADTKREQSSYHHKLITLLYPEIKETLKNPDNIQEGYLIDYATGGNVDG